MSKQIRQRLQIIEDRFGKMALRDMIHVDGGPDTPIHKAAHSGDHDSLKNLLQDPEMRASLNAKNYLGCTPLRLAATAGHVQCVQILLERRADVNVADIKAQTALFVAVKNKHLACVQVLLEAGANPNGDLQCLCTPLYVAAMDGDLPVVRALVLHGADLDRSQISLGSFISTPLYITIAYQHLSCFKHLLLNGANPESALDQPSDRQSLPCCQSLYHATVKHNSNVEYVDWLYEFGASLHHRDDKGRLACDVEESNSCADQVKMLLSEVRCLQSAVRIFVRRYLQGIGRLSNLNELPLPSKLIKFLKYEPVRPVIRM